MLTHSGSITDNRGFILLTTLFILTGLAMLAARALPSIIAQARMRTGQKIVMDIRTIQSACKRYYVKLNPDLGKEEYYWPDATDITIPDRGFEDLSDLNVLPPWNHLTPFKESYLLYTEDRAEGDMYVGVGLPADASDIVGYLSRMLPNAQYVDGKFWSAVPPPGKAKFIEATNQYVEDKFEDFKVNWIFNNVKVIDEGMATVGWWSNYNPWKPGTFYGSRMQVRILRLEVSTYPAYFNSLSGDCDPPAGPQGQECTQRVNDIGLVIPTEGAIYTRYQPNPDMIDADAACKDSTEGCGGTFMPTGRWRVGEMPPP